MEETKQDHLCGVVEREMIEKIGFFLRHNTFSWGIDIQIFSNAVTNNFSPNESLNISNKWEHVPGIQEKI
jgi:hypothetical protein